MHSCTHWLRPRNPIPTHLGSYTRALLVSKDRHLFVTPSGSRFRIPKLDVSRNGQRRSCIKQKCSTYISGSVIPKITQLRLRGISARCRRNFPSIDFHDCLSQVSNLARNKCLLSPCQPRCNYSIYQCCGSGSVGSI